MLLIRGQPDRSWSTDELVRELRASPPLVGGIVEALEKAGLVRRDEELRYAYAPAVPALAELVDRLERAYREAPVRVVNAIVAPPESKLQTFADAFRLKGDPK